MADRDGTRGRTGPPLIESVSMVGERDPDAGGWSARDWVPGPAGTVGVSLPGGVELDVDVATPDTFVGLWVDDVDGRPRDEAVATLVALVGEPRAFELLDLPAGAPRPLVRGDELSRIRRRENWGTFDPSEPGVAAPLARHALALDQSTELSASDLVVALALIDAAASAGDVRGLDLRSRIRDAATRGVTMLLDQWPDVGSVDRALLHDRLRRIARLVDDQRVRRGVRRLIDDLGNGRGGDRRLASMVEPSLMAPDAELTYARSSAAPAPVARLVDVDVSTLAESYGVAHAAGRATTESEAEVRLPGRVDLAERLWARAHGQDGVVLAVSRFVAHGDDAVARLLVPPASLPTAALDITDRPADPRPARAVTSMARAIEHGRAAARADRLADRKEQFSRWGRTSNSWADAGDHDRARQAMQFAEDGNAGRRVPEPLLADPVVEAGG